MVCIYCGGETQVINSRHQKKNNQVWRRRKCTSCLAVYTTIEATDASQALRLRRKTISETGTSKTQLAKSSSSKSLYTKLEPFSRDILLLSIYDSLRHRKTAINDASGLTATIMSEVYVAASEATIDRETLIELATTVLKRFDNVAATHYQAFHN